MLRIDELNFGFNDAENYRRKENKELFNKIFVRTEELDKLLHTNIYFLLGEKGTGKTAYAVYLSNNYYKNHQCRINYIRETEYQKFITLKKEKHLQLSDYTSIWKVIICLLIAQKISEDEEDGSLLNSFFKFKNLKKAIDEYYSYAFTPEIIYAINFIENSKLAAELLSKYIKVGGELNTNISFSESHFQTNLLFIQKEFEDALRSIKLKKNHLLFIDGIDIRPGSIPHADYLECIKGLANAVWSINNDFFSSIKDSPGRMRVVLLMRPDIFVSLNLQNQNNKIRDNSILLDLITTYQDYRISPLFKIVDQLMSAQQKEKLDIGKAWDYYFPYKAVNFKTKRIEDSSFIPFLRSSFYRPRDFISMLSILKDNFIKKNKNSTAVFQEEDFEENDFKRNYSDYLLGEIKDHLTFYYSGKDYELFLKYFQYLDGKINFTYEEFTSAFSKLYSYVSKNKLNMPDFMGSPDLFLQFIYELNVIGYLEEAKDEFFIHWCFKDRNYSNIAPKIRTHIRYVVHYGLSKALNLGKPLVKR